MAISKGINSVCLSDILSKVTEADILFYYLGITKIPTIINSPLRKDNNPSFGLYFNGKRIYYIDFATKERGGVFDLLGQMWRCSYTKVLLRINKDIPSFSNSEVKTYKYNFKTIKSYNKDIKLQCKIREWRDYDIKYWASYGISLEWLKYAEVYPISHKIIIKNNNRYVFSADKYAYAYVEHKEGNITLKIYQPFNTKGYKWSNKHDSSVISLWTKIPEYGEKVCICSSLKDAICLWANTGIPSISIQGEGYTISNTAIKELKKRYKKIFICLDNDKPGLEDAEKLAKETGFINIVLPQFDNGKDISDLFKLKGKEEFIKIVLPLFNQIDNKYQDDLPFEVF